MRIFYLVIALIAAGTLTGAEKSSRIYKLTDDRGTEGVTLVVDSVQYRQDLTRLYGHIDGVPHRAHRIDGLALTVSDGVSYTATDIDGVDFHRWFQWEDDARIPLEIDFAPMKPQIGFLIECRTPKGDQAWEYKENSNIKTNRNN